MGLAHRFGGWHILVGLFNNSSRRQPRMPGCQHQTLMMMCLAAGDFGHQRELLNMSLHV